ncbi:hypothetical protein BC829DRAFT_446889 [Chytridium lagenaria]|nr:hypothetical protein BC829DRAFT_446889 [Chytridium lagenaria]
MAAVVAEGLRNFSQLPSRVISSIVDNLRDHSDHVSLLRVCKGWCNTVAEAMYRAPPLESPDSFERLMGLLTTPLPFVPYPVMIRELDISGNAADNLYMGDLDAVLGMVPNLEVFRLENCFHISNILIQSLAHHCPNLLQLDIPGCPISDSFVPALTKKCRHLLRLDLSFTNVTIASIHPIISFSESLLELDLSECREADDLTSLDLSNKGFRRPLKSLNLRNTPVTDDLLRFAISQCPELEIIILESCPNVTDDAVIKIVNTCHKLRSLDCSFCDRITDLSLNALTVRAASSNGGSLEELYLSACDLITPAAVHQMVQKATKLELLVLDGCERILGSYVQEFAIDRLDELECSIEGDSLRALASYHAVASLATPPASPARPHVEESPLRVQVTGVYEECVGTGEAAAAIAAAKEAAGSGREKEMVGSDLSLSSSSSLSSSPTSPTPGVQRRSSRTLRHRRSLLGLSARSEDCDEDAVENAKMERQEKIREKRRSTSVTTCCCGVMYPSFSSSPLTAEPVGGEGLVSPVSTTTTTSAPKSAIDEEAAKAAFLAALAAKGVKVATPGEEGTTTTTTTTHASPSKRASTLSLKASEFVPTTTPGSVGVWSGEDPWDAASGGKVGRRVSVGTPVGPPAAGSAGVWTPPVGIAGGAGAAVAGAAGGVAAGGAAGVAGAGTVVGDGVLLFSGRAARAASMSKPVEMTASNGGVLTERGRLSPSPTPMEPQDGSILIASGRRRTRTDSIVQEKEVTATNTETPAWIHQPAAPIVPAATMPWGTDPTVWNNPAQLTSSSSTWSTTTNETWNAGVRATGVLGPAVNTSSLDPWAAAPVSVAAVVPPVHGVGKAVVVPPVHGGKVGWSVGGAGWGPSVGVLGKVGRSGTGRFGSVGVRSEKEVEKVEKVEEVKGRMLLKLKIETRGGGHQTLAVHELDDPVQLATEFVTYWDMLAFKEPLVRLISVRKTNVLRSRGHH